MLIDLAPRKFIAVGLALIICALLRTSSLIVPSPQTAPSHTPLSNQLYNLGEERVLEVQPWRRGTMVFSAASHRWGLVRLSSLLTPRISFFRGGDD